MLKYIFYLCFYILLVDTSPLQSDLSEKIPFHKINGRILNGENATLGQFPWHVGVLTANNYSALWCSGSIISEEWILTSAQCINGGMVTYVYAGLIDLEAPAVLVLADVRILHEDFDATTLANDIGLVQLRTPLEFDDAVAPIALASDPLDAGADITVTGFGQTSDDDFQIGQFLNFVTLTTIENSECSETYGDAILEGIVCAATGDDPVKGPCIGDSGGPGVINADSDPVLVAVNSFISGTGCESGNPAGYTRVDYYRDWIEENSGV